MPKNSMYLYGKNSVLERITANPESIKAVYLQENFKSPRILGLIKAKNISCRHVREKELARIKRADRLQGIVAEVDRFSYTDYNSLLSAKGSQQHTLIFLDEIMDPHNLGSILRVTACLGGFGLVIPRHSGCGVNDTVMHVASGGENYTPVSVVSNTINALAKAKERGYWIAGTAAEGGDNIHRLELPRPLAIVFGSEGRGIKPAVSKHLDLNLTLSMKGAKLSLNVAMAAAIFCYEIDRQRHLPGKTSP